MPIPFTSVRSSLCGYIFALHNRKNLQPSSHDLLRNTFNTMRLRFLLSALSLLAFAFGGTTHLSAQAFPNYRSLSELQPSAPGALRYGLYGFVNPAMLAPLERSDLEFIWSDGGGDWNSFNRWGLFSGMPNFGFGMVHDKSGGRSVTDYRISFAGGDRSGGFGIGYGWSGGDDADSVGRHSHLTLGLLARPNQYLSIGLSGVLAFTGGARNGVVDVAVRPMGNELLTVFGDYSLREKDQIGDGQWSAGVVVEALPGIRLTGRYFDTEALSLGVGFSLGSLGLGSQATFDNDFNHMQTTYSIRSGQYDRNIFRGMWGDRYLVMDLKGPMAYRRFVLFDNTRTLSGTLDEIDAAGEDNTIAGIAINTSGMMIDREMLWEIREKLREFKASGKSVVVYFDRADIDAYHFISIADRVVMDPLGTLDMRGYASSRTYYKEMLDKIGIGFEEIRLFRYKSAYENFARNEMSPGEREQRTRMVDVLYEVARDDVTAERNISNGEYDRIIDSVALIRPSEALRLGLVDAVGRWDTVQSVISQIESLHVFRPGMVGAGSLARYQLPTDNRWSEPPQIAILYADGVCAMDEGINARELTKLVDQAANNLLIKGVVLRVDSPGGDGLASDLVAEALRRCSKRKPTIVSQGYVAGSGGYWLSMYGDVIVASPNTITGSIGVISAWIYNKGAFDSIGANAEIIARGAHADLGLGPELPFIGLQLPERNMDAAERKAFEENIRSFYDEFVERVASGRKMTVAQVDSVAQGRVWMGIDAKRVGLVDSLGGLDLAIAIARDRAGIKPDEEVVYAEYPAPSLFDPSILAPSLFSLFGSEVRKEWTLLDDVRFRLEQNGRPMPMMPVDVEGSRK